MTSELSFLLERAEWPVLLIDRSGSIQHANPAAVRLLGPEAGASSATLAVFWAAENSSTPAKFFADWEQTPRSPAVWQLRTAEKKTAACQVTLCATDKPGQFLAQILPGTAPAAQPASTPEDSATAQKQKLDCALQLARTVSLDFNNALTSILGHTSLLLSKTEANHPWRASLLEVEKSAARAAEIANDLGTFSRQQKETRAQHAGNLNQVLQRTVDFLQQNGADKKVEWRLQFERQLFAARFDEAKMQQALIKIFENAIEAITHSGMIIAQTRNLELAEATQDRNAQLLAGTYVCIEISDNGHGIPAEVLPRIFEPFYTTKGGKHRGLGLAWVYGIVTNHGGGVSVSSQVEAGTSVRIYLPAERRVVRDNGPSTEDLTGNATILIVDDEDLLLTMGQMILSAFGYRVLTANSGQRALEMLNAGNPRVDLVLTDLIMPSMSGRELVEHIQKLPWCPRILCTSGYVWPAGQINEANYIQKPFTSQDLLQKVKQILAS